MAKALGPHIGGYPAGTGPVTAPVTVLTTAPAPPDRCVYCGQVTEHPVTRCRAVKEIHYYPNGSIQKIVKR